MTLPDWREGYVTGGGTRFFVRELGHSDDLILLLHGWPQDGSMWRSVAPLLVEAGYQVACPDLKGFGRSDTPHGGYDPPTLSDEISQLIRRLQFQRATVVGHDWGGAVATATAFRHPAQVRRLVVADAPFRELDLRASWHIPLFNLPVLPELAFRTAAGPLVRRAIRRTSVVTEAFGDDDFARYARAVSADPAAWLCYYRGLSRHVALDLARRSTRLAVDALDDPPERHRLDVPALVIWGEQDPAVPHDLAPDVAEDLGGELVTLDGVGHFVAEEDPLRFARAVAGFVGTPVDGRDVPS